MKLNTYIAKAEKIEGIKVTTSNMDKIAKYISNFTICSVRHGGSIRKVPLCIIVQKQQANKGDFIVKIGDNFKVIQGDAFNTLYQIVDKSTNTPSIDKQWLIYDSKDFFLDKRLWHEKHE